jgi:hypothetical protein
MALFGWSSPQKASVYTKKGNRARHEAQAAAFYKRKPATKVSHFLRRWRPVGKSGQNSFDNQW